MNKNYIVVLLLFGLQVLQAQQLPDRSYFSNMNFIWNPAITGSYQHWEAFGSYRQQWAGFEGNPETITVGTQFPILEYNMGIGGFINQDYIQPISSTNLGLTYAYHIQTGFFGSDVFSIGLIGTATQFSIDPNQIFITDADDLLIPEGENSQFTYNMGIGFYYVSHSNAYSQSFSDESYIYFGAAANQIIPLDLIFDNSNQTPLNFKRAIHANAIFGAKILTDYFSVEPFVWANYTEGNVFNVNLGVNLEMYDLLWGGIAYSSTNNVTLQAGYILNDSFLPPYNSIRIGTLASFNSAGAVQPRGLSYEFFIGYRYLL